MSSKSQDKELNEHRSMFILKGASASYAQQKEKLQDRVRNLTLSQGKRGGSSNRLAKLIWNYKKVARDDKNASGKDAALFGESLPGKKLKSARSDTGLDAIDPALSLDLPPGRVKGRPIRSSTADPRTSMEDENAEAGSSSPVAGRTENVISANLGQKIGYRKMEEHQRSRITRKFEMLTKCDVTANEWSDPMLRASALRRSLVEGPPGMAEAEVDIIFNDCIGCGCDGDEDPLVSLAGFYELCIRTLSWQKLPRSPFGNPRGAFQ